MSTPICCQNQSSFLRRAVGVWQWLLPTAILALLPKCPACLAGYVMLWTGLSLSLAIAGVVRTGLLVLCIAALAWVVFRRLRFYFTKETQP